MAGARSIISSPALVIIVQINMPPVRKTICKRTLPYLTLEGWDRKPQSIANPVRIRTRSTDSYREAEYPYGIGIVFGVWVHTFVTQSHGLHV